jgi:hypothetical protein
MSEKRTGHPHKETLVSRVEKETQKRKSRGVFFTAVDTLTDPTEILRFFNEYVAELQASGMRRNAEKTVKHSIVAVLEEYGNPNDATRWAEALDLNSVLQKRLHAAVQEAMRKRGKESEVIDFLKQWLERLQKFGRPHPFRYLRYTIQSILMHETDGEIRERWLASLRQLAEDQKNAPQEQPPKEPLPQKTQKPQKPPARPAVESNALSSILRELDAPGTVNPYARAVDELVEPSEIEAFIRHALERWRRHGADDPFEMVQGNIDRFLQRHPSSTTKLLWHAAVDAARGSIK